MEFPVKKKIQKIELTIAMSAHRLEISPYPQLEFAEIDPPPNTAWELYWQGFHINTYCGCITCKLH
jgi:hypothetical protein